MGDKIETRRPEGNPGGEPSSFPSVVDKIDMWAGGGPVLLRSARSVFSSSSLVDISSFVAWRRSFSSAAVGSPLLRRWDRSSEGVPSASVLRVTLLAVVVVVGGPAEKKEGGSVREAGGCEGEGRVEVVEGKDRLLSLLSTAIPIVPDVLPSPLPGCPV